MRQTCCQTEKVRTERGREREKKGRKVEGKEREGERAVAGANSKEERESNGSRSGMTRG